MNFSTSFPIILGSAQERYSDTISKGRCRIFYKGLNRNGVYITAEFAEKLMKTVAYTPVKGIYDFTEEDYEDHGKVRSEGRIYGVVPANPNFAWEKHLDEDGIEREYACVDVLYYTALYEEASKINGKGQSMELYRKTLRGRWTNIYGRQAYELLEGCFLGLQALGDDVEPCFEGAAFYAQHDITEILKKYEEKDIFSLDLGGEKMSDNVLDTVQTDETTVPVVEPTEEPNVAEPVTEPVTEPVEPTVPAEPAEPAEPETPAEPTEPEIPTEINERILELERQNVELSEQNSTLIIERDEFSALVGSLKEELETLRNQNAELNSTISSLNANITTLKAEVNEYAKTEKMAIVNNYIEVLDEDTIESYVSSLDQYDLISLDKELSYEVKKANPNLFAKNKTSLGLIPKDHENGRGIADILSKYEK